MKQIGARLTVALLVLVTLSGCAMTTVRQHPDFASGKRNIKTIAILPSEVEYRHLVFTGENERDPKLEKSITNTIETSIGNLLQKRGYTAKLEVLEKAQAGDKEFNFQVEQFKGAYNEIAKELYAQPMIQADQSATFKLGVGALANPLARLCGADALMMIRYQGFDKSGGMVAKEVIASALLGALTGVVAVPAKMGGQIEITLIDGISGDVLWSNIAGGPVGAYANMANALAKLSVSPGMGGENLVANTSKPSSADTAPITLMPERAVQSGAPHAVQTAVTP